MTYIYRLKFEDEKEVYAFYLGNFKLVYLSSKDES